MEKKSRDSKILQTSSFWRPWKLFLNVMYIKPSWCKYSSGPKWPSNICTNPNCPIFKKSILRQTGNWWWWWWCQLWWRYVFLYVKWKHTLLNHTEKIWNWVLIISSASFHLLSLSPPGSMTRQESPSSTLFHYGEHWWPLDRQPKKRLPTLPTPPPPPTTPTSQPTPPKSSSRKGRRLLQGPHTGNKVQQKSPELIILVLHYILCRKWPCGHRSVSQ